MNEEYVECADCGIVERLDWAGAGKHICNQITDPKYRVLKDMNLKIGKCRYLKIKVNASR